MAHYSQILSVSYLIRSILEKDHVSYFVTKTQNVTKRENGIA